MPRFPNGFDKNAFWWLLSNNWVEWEFLHAEALRNFINRNNSLGGDYMIPVSRDEILSWQCYKLFINYILRLHVKRFITARRDPSFPGKFLRLIWRQSVRKKVSKYLCRISSFYRSRPPEVFSKKGVLKNFAVFTGKHLCWNLFADLQVYNLKRDSNADVFLWILRNF